MTTLTSLCDKALVCFIVICNLLGNNSLVYINNEKKVTLDKMKGRIKKNHNRLARRLNEIFLPTFMLLFLNGPILRNENNITNIFSTKMPIIRHDSSHIR